MGIEVNGNFTENIFDGRCKKYLDLHTKLHFCQHPLLIGLGWVNLIKPFFSRKYIKGPKLYRKVLLASNPPQGNGINLQSFSLSGIT